MISPHAAQASSNTATWNGPSGMGVAGAASAADTSLFQSLFAGLAAATSGEVTDSASPTNNAPVPDAKQRGEAHKSGDATQTSALTSDQPIMIAAQNPLPWLLNSMTMPSSAAETADQATGAQATSAAVVQVQRVAGDAATNISTATQSQPVPMAAVTPVAPGLTKMLALLTPVAPYTLTNSDAPGPSDKSANNTNEITSISTQALNFVESPSGGEQSSVPASAGFIPIAASTLPAQPMQTVFSVLVHPAADKEQAFLTGAATAMPDQWVTADQTSTAEPQLMAAAPVPAEGGASTPISAQSTTNTPQTNVAPTALSTPGASALGNSLSNQSAQAVSAANAATGSVVTPSNRAEAAGSNTNSKSSPDQSEDKQARVPVIDPNNAAPVGSRFEPVPPAAATNARPVTEYVAPQHTSTTAATTPSGAVTDIRVQVDGGANQHVNVRVVQEPEGLRVTVRSNDENLTQTLQDRLPELTSRLEQHHFQADVSMPERPAATLSGQTGPGTNPQQDTSGRNQNSGGQSNPQNRQNQQQEQTPEDETFASLLRIRR